MKDWDTIIDRHLEAETISEKQAADLKVFAAEVKEAGIVNTVRNSKLLSRLGQTRVGQYGKESLYELGGAIKKILESPPGKLVALGAGAAGAAELADRAVINPLGERRRYQAMRNKLEQIDDIAATSSDEDIHNAYSLVRHYAPTMTQDPLAAATAVRSMLASDHNMNPELIRTLTSIQANVDSAQQQRKRRTLAGAAQGGAQTTQKLLRIASNLQGGK